jgi:tetratricopeptide (TPR) repeat protein
MMLCLLTACGSKNERDQASFEKDTAAVTGVRRIQASMASSKSISQSDLDLLKKLYAKYPAASEVRQAFQSALQMRQDWTALVTLLSEKPQQERTPQEQVFLAKVLIKLGRYQDSSHILGPMADAAPNDLELNSLAGHAWYYEGTYDEASRAFDRVWDQVIASGQIDEMLMRGMIYFYKGDKDRAIEILKKTVELKPNYVAGNNALSRVYAAKGDQQQAAIFRTQAENAHARQTADEARRMRVTSRSRDLESAFATARYDDCIQIARELLQTADDALKPVLYEYIGKSYQATGRQTEAQAAFQEAARLHQQTKP